MEELGLGRRAGRERKDREDGPDSPWRDAIKNLRAGQVVEIPVDDEGDLRKKQQQLTRRAERHGFQIELTSDQGVLRARRTGDVEPTARGNGERGDREARRERRRAARARGEASADEE